MPLPRGKIGEAIVNKYFPSEKWEEQYYCETADIKAVSEYTGLNFNEIYNLPYSLFLLYRKDAWLSGLKGTEKGQEFLETLWGLTQTKADYEAIGKFQGKEEK
ncbi:hypothetical protein K5V21_06080 [Clostridium sardiniense]|uniref:Uncharacterized protein n=1 Tax=Clostridium sardiniense TaxID=29369 RepID=A0ABS7KWH4_CLOSR|nr:hypothetical protein [Clostridium sardiniense]